ncbi:hypothetical protein BaRGS_00032185 [Batillaria attramentaria]|uniref:Secreted protein n=1 Tax=Batillaria attramentaria TaxID=370345 RepID=A0ABD0JQ01_9CAEN
MSKDKPTIFLFFSVLRIVCLYPFCLVSIRAKLGRETDWLFIVVAVRNPSCASRAKHNTPPEIAFCYVNPGNSWSPMPENAFRQVACMHSAKTPRS